MKLCAMKDNPGARTKKRLLGRGVGSGLGKTSGRGGKGQTARSGVRLKGFQGGQTPLSRRLPKRGFCNIHAKTFSEINLWQIQEIIDSGKINPQEIQEVMTAETFEKCGVFKKSHDGVKVLGNGELTACIHIAVHGISASARAVIEKMGGTVTLIKASSRAVIEKMGETVTLIEG